MRQLGTEGEATFRTKGVEVKITDRKMAGVGWARVVGPFPKMTR